MVNQTIWPPGATNFGATLDALTSTPTFQSWRNGSEKADALLRLQGSFYGTHFASSLATYLHNNMPPSAPIREGIALACLDFRDPTTCSAEHILSTFVDILDSSNPAFHAQLQRVITGTLKPYRSKVAKIKNLLQTVTCEPICAVYDRVLLIVGGTEALTLSGRRVLLSELRGLLEACAGAVRLMLVGCEKGEDWEEGGECHRMDLEVSTRDVIENVDAHWRSELASGIITEEIYNQLLISEGILQTLPIYSAMFRYKEDESSFLSCLPTHGLPPLFSRILSATLGKAPGILRPILNWVYGAQRPLTLTELFEVISITCSKEQVASINGALDSAKLADLTCGLVIAGPDGRIGFSNTRIPEYLAVANGHELFTFEQARVDAELAKRCLTYLLDPGSLQGPLYSYASSFWHYHARDVDDADIELLELICSAQQKLGTSSPIVLAARYGLIGTLKKYLAEPKLKNDVHQLTAALQAAAEASHPRAVAVLLASGLIPKSNRIAAMETACRYGHLEVLQRLLPQSTAAQDCKIMNHLYEDYVLDGGHTSIFQYFIDLGYSIAEGKERASIKAMILDHRDIYSHILYSGIDIEVECFPYGCALVRAALGGLVENVRMLLRAGADPNHPTDYNTPLSAAAATVSSHPPELAWGMIRLLLTHGGILRDSGALQRAAEGGSVRLIEQLLAMGMEIDDMGEACIEMSALAVAANEGRRDVVEILLKKGADPNKHLIPDYEGTWVGKPLRLATERGHKDVVALLREWGATDS
ncbi:ankyrin repeat-containing domain protein [Tirmania nivea]|nr:ankyrin repeat-containing domain protein [Tirmania nivea]